LSEIGDILILAFFPYLKFSKVKNLIALRESNFRVASTTKQVIFKGRLWLV